METIFSIICILITIVLYVWYYKKLNYPKHDYSGNLDKQKEEYENSILFPINVLPCSDSVLG